MKNEVERLLEDLDYIRDNAGTAGPDHPKVKKWVGEVRNHLAHEGSAKHRKQVEHLEILKAGSEMWSEDRITPAVVKKLRAELGVIEAILKETSDPSRAPGKSSADQKMRELFLISEEAEVENRTSDSPKQEEEEFLDEIHDEIHPVETAMDEKIEPNFETVTKQHGSTSTREQTIDRLMAALNAEMKSADPDWERIQETMGALMGLKKTGELLDRLKSEIKKEGAKWATVREIMAQLWTIKREILIDLLPTLLKS